MSNSLDPDQDRCSVGPDLVANCLQRISADDAVSRERVLKSRNSNNVPVRKNYLKKLILKKVFKADDTKSVKNYPGCKELKSRCGFDTDLKHFTL